MPTLFYIFWNVILIFWFFDLASRWLLISHNFPGQCDQHRCIWLLSLRQTKPNEVCIMQFALASIMLCYRFEKSSNLGLRWSYCSVSFHVVYSEGIVAIGFGCMANHDKGRCSIFWSQIKIEVQWFFTKCSIYINASRCGNDSQMQHALTFYFIVWMSFPIKSHSESL